MEGQNIKQYEVTCVYSHKEAATDIVLVHGLNGHPKATWTASNGVFWPSELLPKTLKQAKVRVLVYGYNANVYTVGRESVASSDMIHQHAQTVLTTLSRERIDEEKNQNAIIWVVHSLGGILVKKALLLGAGSKHMLSNSAGSIYVSSYGIIFLATPHHGSTKLLDNLERLVSNFSQDAMVDTRTQLLSTLQLDNETLPNINTDFLDICGRFQMVMAHESKRTTFANGSPADFIIDPASANLDLPEVENFGIEAAHEEVCKFECDTSPGYRNITGKINLWVTRCSRIIQRRWNNEEMDRALNRKRRADEMLGDFLMVKQMEALSSNSPPAKLDEATKECLNKLKVTDPDLDMMRIENSKDPLLKGCYEWILQNKLLQEWRDSDTCSLLWINGGPGKGKTMLMIALVRELRMNVRGNSPAVAVFFCQSTDIRLNNAVAILRGLIWKLAMNRPELARIFCQEYESDQSLLDGPNAVYALFSVLIRMLNEQPGTTILIDALDECDAGMGRNQLLDRITKDASSSSRTKWLLSSRNNPDIKQLLRSESQMLHLELNDEHISQAVNVFIQQKTRELATTKNYDQDLADKVKEELMAKSNSTFLWVALACKNLLKVTKRKTLSALQKLPPELKPLYQQMIEEILQLEDDEERQFFFRILRVICQVFRPLSVEELIPTAELPEDFLVDDLLELIDKCSSFVTVRQGNIYFVHQSAKDYLTSSDAQKLYSGGMREEQGMIVHRSLSTMSKTLQQDMCKLKHPGSLARTAKIRDRLKAIQYMCCFWVDHLVEYFDGNPNDIRFYKEDGGPVQRFLLEHLLHWLEALSLFGEYNRGVLAILSLESLVPADKSPKLHAFIHDAKRFALFFRSVIGQAPLQLYCSALVFAPANSIVRRQFEINIPPWILRKPKVQANWDAALQTLEGHSDWVTSVAFSPDGSVLASASDDRTVRLWDAATGAARQKLEGHSDLVTSVAFSPDGSVLASASHDRTVRLWDAATGAARQKLEVGEIVYSMSFSSSGQCLSTNRGSFRLSPPDSSSPNYTDTSDVVLSPPHTSSSNSTGTLDAFAVVEEWITKDETGILWLPPDYRANCVAVSKTVVVLGHMSGRVSIFQFARDSRLVL